MVKQWDVNGHDDMECVEGGPYVLHSNYAALQASHALLLVACGQAHDRIRYLNQLNGKSIDANLTISLSAAIAAAQPFTETP